MEKQNLIKFYHAAGEKIGVVPCGVNLDLFRPRDKQAARKLLGLDEKTPTALYVGRFDPIKGIDRLLEAIGHLRQQKSVQLLIIGGEGPETEEFQDFQQMAHELGIADSVTFVGRIEQNRLPPYYRAADTLVIPSHYESFGLVGLESLACGTPVVSTPVGAMSAILQSGKAGALVENAGPIPLADGIASIFARQQAGEFSAEKVRASVYPFSWQHVASDIIDEYAAVFNRFSPHELPKASARASCH
jgi:D-inositol-3-phosphate glycosyltransferase